MTEQKRPPLHPVAANFVSSFSAAGLLGVMANRPWYAAAAWLVAFLAFLAGWDWAE